MCGIAGFFGKAGYYLDKGYIRSLLEQLEHRGPDGMGVLYPSLSKEATITNSIPHGYGPLNWFLVHRRLSILDLETRGLQPMMDTDSDTVIAYNGEVYNYKELRGALISLGHTFQTATDTEVVLKAYNEWGIHAFSKFNGMFAVVIMELKKRKLTMARDVFGIKPLYYSATDEGLHIGSEIKTLLQFPGITSKVNAEQAYYYLRYGLTDMYDETMFEGVHQVPPGSVIQCVYEPFTTLGEPRPYTTLFSTEVDRSITFDDACRQVRKLFLESIQLHTRSDVPFGISLSGGLDSSAVLMGVRKAFPSTALTTISYENNHAPLNEGKWIRLACNYAQAESCSVIIDPTSFKQDYIDLIRVQEQPVYSASAYAQYRVFKHASDIGLKVMLDGQGADELFGGYEHFVLAAFYTFCRENKWIDAMSLVKSLVSQQRHKLLWFLYRLSFNVLPKSVFRIFESIVGRKEIPSWINQAWLKDRFDPTKPQPLNGYVGSLRAVMRDEVRRISLPHLLRYEDRNSMAHSIESRVPFLSTELAEFTFKLPDNYFYSEKGVSKLVLREALRGLVPDPIIDRTDKIGFVAEDDVWIQTLQATRSEISTSDFFESISILNLDLAKRALVSMRDVRQLWRLINFVEWSRVFKVNFQ